MKGYTATEIKEDFEKNYGESAETYRTVARWVSLFRAFSENIQDEPHSERLSTSESERYSAAIKTIVEEHA